MADESFGERTQRATPRRREQARQEGRVARSAEVTSALVLLVSMAALALFGPTMLHRLGDITQALLGGMVIPIETSADAYQTFRLLSRKVLLVLAPFLLSLMTIGIASNLLQVGFLFTTKPLGPNWGVLNPASGFSRVFGRRGWVELFKAVLKVSAIGLVAYFTVSADLGRLVPLVGVSGGPLLEQAGSATLRLGFRIGMVLLALAAIDYGYQRWEYERSLRMSPKEIEDEQKQTEGDPRVKARVRALQRMLSRNRMIAEVAQADVVVTNPTHVAVALRYDRDTMSAPVVVATGLRKLAQRIKDEARKHGVPIVEDPPLARLLHKEAEVGQPIPVSLYKAVAQVLAQVWRLRNRIGDSP